MQPLLVTAAVIRDGDRILITRRPDGTRYAGMWEFPGGKLDPGEEPRACLRREIIEELDLEVAVGAIIEAAYYRYDWGPVLVLAYECRPLGGAIRNLQVAEHRWIRPQELPDYPLLAADLPIVARLLQTA
jgi:8-oxo-dGTP diphosphatase